MKRPLRPAKAKERRATVLAGVIILQALCAVFFIVDVLQDMREGVHLDDLHLTLESLAALVLLVGVVFLMVELRRLLNRMSDMDAGLRVAQGQMAGVMDGFFEDWNLTAAERDIAIMICKGLDNDEIAQVRHTAAGTVRAQVTRIYAKSGTHGRSQFVSLFLDELMSGEFGETVPQETPQPQV
ncbi:MULTISPECIES: helix-turn-helix transcriptional regulator [Roseobacteraceae]|uniref:Bacterial regulatory protein, luxR family n=1 Tax=Pseudosulfitobacter pseudonitzschiae TaxID=1402135 RepID=A0A221K438_9RHOB|nr:MULTISPECIES: helix-turn-helix transcriptional regulator [Roseobacteraceae]ASM73761.1 bacterial regulatory protein, luxR family [Pseudosulfitobacter pseudonitzschiae]